MALTEKLQGKDLAIQTLTQSLLKKASEHEKQAEMMTQFKNKLIQENCFHVQYAATKVKSGLIGKSEEVTIGFMRDKSFEEEFFLQIESKNFNNKTGLKDKRLIAVDDIHEFEHLGGTRFIIYYQDQTQVLNKGEKFKGAIGGIVNKMKKKKAEESLVVDEIEGRKVESKLMEKKEIYESKFVKEIIDIFNSVIQMQDE